MLQFLLSMFLVQGLQAGRLQDFSVLVAEEVFQATVTATEDGDSLVVRPLTGGDSVRVHIVGVDAPEMPQPWGPEAKAFLDRLLTDKTVTVRIKAAMERLAQVEVDGSDVSLSIVRNGMAWHCPRFAQENDLAHAEAEARRAKRGLWGRPQPTPPWLYRGAGVCWEHQKATAPSRERPDFSGTWTAVNPPERAGQRLRIVQDAETLAIRHDRGEPLAYKLEGTTSRAFTTEHGPSDTVAKSRWNGDVWTVDERQWLVRGQEPRNVRQRLWLDARGLLNLEVSSPRPLGEYDTTIVRYRLSTPNR